MSDDEATARLKIISSKRTPEMITDVVGLNSDRSWRVGDKRPHTIIEEKNYGWVIDSGLLKTNSMEQHVRALLERVAPYKNAIKQLSRDDSVEFSCVLYTHETPALNFNASTIDQIGQLGASLDIDLYLRDGISSAAPRDSERLG